MKLNYFLTPYSKINSKWIKDLDVRPETIKLLEKKIGSTLFDISLSNIFLYVFLEKKNQSKKNKKKQMGLRQTEKLFTAKETINQMKRQSTKWENIFSKDLSNKGLMFNL